MLVIGAGAAGLTAGMWCAELGLKAAVFESSGQAGGQFLNIYNPIKNYPGVISSTGREMRDLFLKSAENTGVQPILGTEISEFDAEENVATDHTGKQYSADYFVLATGVRRRKLNVPGEDRFVGKGILTSGARDKETVSGKTVAIVGGGDAALENALMLAETASKVYLIHRRDKFSARDEFLTRAADDGRIEFLPDSTVSSIDGGSTLSSIILSRKGTKIDLNIDALLIRIGVEPNSSLVAGQVKLDDKGYVMVGSDCKSSIPNVYAVGDVANPVSPTIGTAVGMAATAAKGIRAAF